MNSRRSHRRHGDGNHDRHPQNQEQGQQGQDGGGEETQHRRRQDVEHDQDESGGHAGQGAPFLHPGQRHRRPRPGAQRSHGEDDTAQCSPTGHRERKDRSAEALAGNGRQGEGNGSQSGGGHQDQKGQDQVIHTHGWLPERGACGIASVSQRPAGRAPRRRDARGTGAYLARPTSFITAPRSASLLLMKVAKASPSAKRPPKPRLVRKS